MTWIDFAKIVGPFAGAFVTLIGFIFVIVQLRIALAGLRAANQQNKINQDWKRAEFVASEVKDFYKDPIVIKILQMIDYTDRRYDIGNKDAHGKPLLTRIVHSRSAADRLNNELNEDKLNTELNENPVLSIEAALRTDEKFTPTEATIRDHFDTFLYYIERFERFLKLHLISEDEIFPYLRYYIRIFRGKLDHVDPNMLKSFRTYLQDFHFEDAENFFYRRFDEYAI
jgi:hypothetical protein